MRPVEQHKTARTWSSSDFHGFLTWDKGGVPEKLKFPPIADCTGNRASLLDLESNSTITHRLKHHELFCQHRTQWA